MPYDTKIPMLSKKKIQMLSYIVTQASASKYNRKRALSHGLNQDWSSTTYTPGKLVLVYGSQELRQMDTTT
jgi:hypothetical protein